MTDDVLYHLVHARNLIHAAQGHLDEVDKVSYTRVYLTPELAQLDREIRNRKKETEE